MKTKTVLFLLAACAAFGARATTHVIDVAEGVTTNLDQWVAAEGVTLAADDTIRKTGKGVLKASSTLCKSIKVNLDIQAGVYSLEGAGSQNQKGGVTITIAEGATLYLVTEYTFLDASTVNFAGTGAGFGNYLGAIAVEASQMNPILGVSDTFNMTGDATIYTHSTMNALFSSSGSSVYSTLNMNSHTLTVLGKDENAMFRPRWGWKILNSGPIIVDSGRFSRHKTTNSFSPNIPSVTFKNGALMDTYGDKSLWNLVDAFVFEAGTKISKSALRGEANVTMTLARVTGPVDISSDATVTIGKNFGFRSSDLLAGNKLTSANTLTFAAGCTLSWEESETAPAAGTSYVIASSTAGLSGAPALADVEARVFDLTQSETELSLRLKSNVKIPALQTGSANAEANSAAIETLAAGLADGDIVLFLGDGEYHFARALDFSAATAKNVTFLSSTGKTVLRGELKLGALEDVRVEGLVFKGLSTPAIEATGTVGLTVTNCTLESVTGTYGTLGNYPYALIDVTDFKLTDVTNVPDAAGAASTEWDAQAYFEGGTQTEDSWARAEEIVVSVSSDAQLQNLTNGLHLTVAAYQNKTLRKIGPSQLTVPSTLSLAELNITNLVIQEGKYVANANTSLGALTKPVSVLSGASLVLNGSYENVVSRTISFSGTGLGGADQAVKFSSSAVWNKTTKVTWNIVDDATMYNTEGGEMGMFYIGAVRMQSHTLTLKGISTANYRFGRTMNWYGGGTLVTDGVILSASTQSSSLTDYAVMDGSKPIFKFINGAKFRPDNAAILNLIRDVDFEDGTSIDLKDGISGFALAFDSLVGTPAIGNAFTKLTIRSTYAARVADLDDGKVLTLDASTPLVFEDGAELSLVADTLGYPDKAYTLISAPGGITGKPTVSAAAKAKGWKVWVEDNKLMSGSRCRGCAILWR